jgi:hypothetical protein
LHVSQTGLVEDIKLRSVCLRDIGEVFRIAGIDFFWIRFASLVSKMVPFWGCESKLGLADTFFWQQALQIIPLINISAPDMLDLACADDTLSRLMATFRKGSNVRDRIRLVSVPYMARTQPVTYRTCGRCPYRDFEFLQILLSRERMYPCLN